MQHGNALATSSSPYLLAGCVVLDSRRVNCIAKVRYYPQTSTRINIVSQFGNQ